MQKNERNRISSCMIIYQDEIRLNTYMNSGA